MSSFRRVLQRGGALLSSPPIFSQTSSFPWATPLLAIAFTTSSAVVFSESNTSSNISSSTTSSLKIHPSLSIITKMEDRSLDTILFPPIKPYLTDTLDVSKTHTLYYEECGNPEGKPVVLIHGGPGAGCSEDMRRFHDPKKYRIILVDQRGAGRSTPHASLEDNTTWDLVKDLEKLRKKVQVDSWQVFGGSWGSTLALAYAETYPDVVTELVLRGIFMLRAEELQFYYQHGAHMLYPDAFEKYKSIIPVDERNDFIVAYRKRLLSKDVNVRLPAARAWTTWEKSTSHLIPRKEEKTEPEADDKFCEAFARIENHYFYHRGFFTTDAFLLENVYKIRHVPTVIVQGRYDVVCPMKSAFDLHSVFPESQLKVVQSAGHSAMEVGIAAQLVIATEAFKMQ